MHAHPHAALCTEAWPYPISKTHHLKAMTSVNCRTLLAQAWQEGSNHLQQNAGVVKLQ